MQQKIQAIRERAASTHATPAAPAPTAMHQRAFSLSDAVSSLGASGSAPAPRASLEVDLRSEDGLDAQDHSTGGAGELPAAALEEERSASPTALGSEAQVSKPASASSQPPEVIEL